MDLHRRPLFPSSVPLTYSSSIEEEVQSVRDHLPTHEPNDTCFILSSDRLAAVPFNKVNDIKCATFHNLTPFRFLLLDLRLCS